VRDDFSHSLDGTVIAGLELPTHDSANVRRKFMENVAGSGEEFDDFLGLVGLCRITSPDARRTTANCSQEFIEGRGGIVGFLENRPKLGWYCPEIKIVEQEYCSAPR
jgi:hypothetical protein